jgi:histidinol phosphatase-like enzyme
VYTCEINSFYKKIGGIVVVLKLKAIFLDMDGTILNHHNRVSIFRIIVDNVRRKEAV